MGAMAETGTVVVRGKVAEFLLVLTALMGVLVVEIVIEDIVGGIATVGSVVM